MYLKRLTMVGFKSFAAKTVLDFEPGMTAIVGPNGSGKSNVADAIRWAMGEQSKGKLRLRDREEVVFAGSKQRAKASYAEVVMLFDNEDGSFPLDATEVEIARRLYRSGETDYRLNGRAVRVSDVQMLLAEAGFGTGSYAVIGQGMIDNLLISSPTERKLLFEEAAGIRGFEIKRAEAIRRLEATQLNLTRLRDIKAELEPRRASLQTALATVTRRRELEDQLAELRLRILGIHSHAITNEERSLGEAQAAFEHKQVELMADLTRLEQAEQVTRGALEAAQASRRSSLARLDELTGRCDELTTSLAARRAELAGLEATGDDHTRLTREHRRMERGRQQITAELAELEQRLGEAVTAAAAAQTAMEHTNTEIRAAEKVLKDLRGRTGDGTQQQYVDSALELVKTMARHLGEDDELPREQLRLLVHKAGRLLSYATKTGELALLVELREAQDKLEAIMRRRETAAEHLGNITLSQRSLELDISHQRGELERVSAELARLTQSLAQLPGRAELEQTRRAVQADEAALAEARARLQDCRASLTDLAAEDEQTSLFEAREQLQRARIAVAEHEQVGAALALRRTELARARTEQLARIAAWGLEAPATAAAGDLAELEREEIGLAARLAAEAAHSAEVEGEYAEVAGRLATMEDQLQDLDHAAANLGEVVARLDTSIQQRFSENFAGIAREFQAAFHRLFGGGSASLELVRDEGDYGIEISVSPKGKRMTSLAILSGGERAMAGVALLAAILAVSPSPFVVLDEIDAALDEANSGRLAQLLAELAGRSQLLVITHNRQTMQMAKVLFGITMNDAHTSHLLSLRLDEATSLAAR